MGSLPVGRGGVDMAFGAGPKSSVRKEPLWKVRLAFVGEPFETEDGPVGGGYVTLTVRAADEVTARRLALAEAREAVAELNEEVDPLWSMESVEPARRKVELKLHLYDEPWTLRPEPLAELARRLQEDDVAIQIAEGYLHVPPEGPDRFGVEILYEEMEYTVRTDGWHAHLGDDAPQAVALFQWLLTPFYRLVKEAQEGKPAASWVERYDAEGWTTYHPVLFRNPSDPTRWMGGGWERTYSPQDARPLPVPYDEIVPGITLDDRGYPEGTVLGVETRTFDRPMAEGEEWLASDFTFSPGSADPPPELE